MSQVSIIDIEGNHPEIPTRFDANVGFAIPIANVLEILGDTVISGSIPVQTVASGNTVTTNVQISQAISSSNAANVGLAAFDDDYFTVDANGFVSLITIPGSGIQSVATDIAGPVLPDGGGQISILGQVIAAHGISIQTDGTIANTAFIQLQVASAQAASAIGNAGAASFDQDFFTVDANGFVSAVGSAFGSLFNVDAATAPGIDPVTPNASGIVTITGAQVANGVVGTNVIRTHSVALNQYNIEIQRTAAAASANIALNGVSHFDSAAFDVDADGFVQLNGGGIAAIAFDVDASTPPGTDPVVPSAAGVVTVTGGQVAAGTTANVIQTHSLAANSYAIQIQRSSAQPASTVGANGVAHFNSAQFTVDGDGFVSATGSIPIQFTGDTGTATPAAGNINILGGPGVSTIASGDTVMINSVMFTDTSGAFNAASDNGYFITGAATAILPAVPVQGELIIFYLDTAALLTITANTGQIIRFGDQVSSTAGTWFTDIIGSALTLRYRAATATWCVINSIGNWELT